MRADFYGLQRAWTNAVLADTRFSWAERVIAARWMQNHLNRQTEDTFVSAKTLAYDLGCCKKSVDRCFGKLGTFGYIEHNGWHNRARRRRAIWGLVSPTTEADPDDLGHPATGVGTPQSGDEGHGSRTNQRSKPSEPVCADQPDPGAREQGGLLSCDQLSPFQAKRLVERWEDRIKEVPERAEIMPILKRLTEAKKLELAIQAENEAQTPADIIRGLKSQVL